MGGRSNRAGRWSPDSLRQSSGGGGGAAIGAALLGLMGIPVGNVTSMAGGGGGGTNFQQVMGPTEPTDYVSQSSSNAVQQAQPQPITNTFQPQKYKVQNRTLDFLFNKGRGASEARQMNFQQDQMLMQSELERKLRNEIEDKRGGYDVALKNADIQKAIMESADKEKLQTAKYNQDRDIQVLTNVAKIMADKGIPFDAASLPMLISTLQQPTLQAALAKAAQDRMTAEAEQNKLKTITPNVQRKEALEAEAGVRDFSVYNGAKRREAELKPSMLDAQLAKAKNEVTAGKYGISPNFVVNYETGMATQLARPASEYEAMKMDTARGEQSMLSETMKKAGFNVPTNQPSSFNPVNTFNINSLGGTQVGQPITNRFQTNINQNGIPTTPKSTQQKTVQEAETEALSDAPTLNDPPKLPQDDLVPVIAPDGRTGKVKRNKISTLPQGWRTQ